MEISPYILGVMAIALLIMKEFILGSALLLVCIAQITMPNLNVENNLRAMYIRLGLSGVVFFSLIVSIISHIRR
jgi:hypothetical protein